MNLNDRLRNAGAPQALKTSSSDPMQQVGDESIASFQMLEDIWKRAEAKLALSHVPVNVRIKVGGGLIGPGGNPFGEFTNYLGYVRVKNQWRICFIEEKVSYNVPETEKETDCRPITECPADVRLEMFDWFPKLYEEVIKVTKGYVKKIKDKVAKFETTLEFIDL